MSDAAHAYMQKIAREDHDLDADAALGRSRRWHVKDPNRWDLVSDLGVLNEKLGEAAAAIQREPR